MQPVVSIVMPTYNSADYIAESIEAIISQTYNLWELLITDDCSVDSTCDIIRKYMELDSRIKLFQLHENSGAGVARNNSINNSSGSYIAFCDSDDVWRTDKLEKQLEYMKKNNINVCYSSYMLQDEFGEVFGINICPPKTTYNSIKCDNKMGNLTVIYNAEKLGKTLFPNLRKRQDWGMNIILLRKSQVAYGVIEPLAYYRVRKGSLSRKKTSLFKWNVRVYKEILNYSSIHAWLRLIFIFLPTHIYKLFKLKIINT